ncbi:MAG: HU family DNA-binding protein [Bacteroidota bacterium]|nr:HU family DNA-binding protein [Bacteroidota bacterium]
MTKDELATEISRKTGIDKVVVVKTIESLMETVKLNMTNNKNIYLRGFGTFLVKKRAEKTARNISKNTVVIIPEHFIPSFKPSKEFIDEVKTKKA